MKRNLTKSYTQMTNSVDSDDYSLTHIMLCTYQDINRNIFLNILCIFPRKWGLPFSVPVNCINSHEILGPIFYGVGRIRGWLREVVRVREK